MGTRIVLLSPNDVQIIFISYKFRACVSGVAYYRTCSPLFKRQTVEHTWIVYRRINVLEIFCGEWESEKANKIGKCLSKMKIANEE